VLLQRPHCSTSWLFRILLWNGIHALFVDEAALNLVQIIVSVLFHLIFLFFSPQVAFILVISWLRLNHTALILVVEGTLLKYLLTNLILSSLHERWSLSHCDLGRPIWSIIRVVFLMFDLFLHDPAKVLPFEELLYRFGVKLAVVSFQHFIEFPFIYLWLELALFILFNLKLLSQSVVSLIFILIPQLMPIIDRKLLIEDLIMVPFWSLGYLWSEGTYLLLTFILIVLELLSRILFVLLENRAIVIELLPPWQGTILRLNRFVLTKLIIDLIAWVDLWSEGELLIEVYGWFH